MSAPRIEEAISQHQAGVLSEAERLYRQILEADPLRADAIHLLGVIELQRGDAGAAVRLITHAVAINPGDARALNHLGEAYRALGRIEDAATSYHRALAIDPLLAEAHSNLGIALQSLDRLDEAIDCFRAATAAKPDWSAAYFNLGLTLKRKRDLQGAAVAFARGWIRDPSRLDAAGQCVATVAEQARSGLAPASAARLAPVPSGTSISAIFCSVDDRKCEATRSMYERLLSGVKHEIIAVRDARSLAEAYNRAIHASAGTIVVLSHDDIDILAPDFARIVHERLKFADAIGVVGGTAMTGPLWGSCGHPHLRGWITHRDPNGTRHTVGALSPFPGSEGLATLDGVFIAARREVFNQVPFDEATFDGFHLYDIDWSYRAAKANFRLRTAGDLLIVHQSRGKFAADWYGYAERFCRKYDVELRQNVSLMFVEGELESPGEVRGFFAQLASVTELAHRDDAHKG